MICWIRHIGTRGVTGSTFKFSSQIKALCGMDYSGALVA